MPLTRSTARKMGQFVDSFFDDLCQQLNLRRCIVCCAKYVSDLLVAQSREPVANPTGVGYRDVFKQAGALSAIMKFDAIVLHGLNKIGLCIFAGIIPASRESPENRCTTGMTKGCSQIANNVTEFRWVAGPFCENLIVRVFYVPVVEQTHHHLQALKFARAYEGVLAPLPSIKSFEILRPCFKSHVAESSFAGNFNPRHEVVNLSFIASRP